MTSSLHQLPPGRSRSAEDLACLFKTEGSSKMELFIINRYTGDEPTKVSTTSEEELRKTLMKKIKKRKRLNELLVKGKSYLKCKNSEIINTKRNSERKENNEDQEEMDKTRESKMLLKKIKIDESNEKYSDKKGVGKNDIIETEKIEKNNQDGAFLQLGNVPMSKIEKIKRKLPNWLSNPSVVSVDLKNLTCTIDSIPELDKIFVDKLQENDITYFFPVQSQVIPWLLRRATTPHMYWHNDICVSAPTGSGKTLAFVLPILQFLYKRIVPKIRALVVLPVQDLALQVYNVFKKFSQPTDLNILLLSKKVPFEEEQSLICKSDGTGKYKTLVDIIITTPGRLVDHLTKTKGICLNDLIYLVIDEADRVMENIQNDWLYHLNKCLTIECTRAYQIPVISYHNMTQKKKLPHKLLFSATLSQDPEKLQQLGLFQPKLFTSVVKSSFGKNDAQAGTQFIGKYTTPDELTEYFICCTKMNKPLIVHHLISSNTWKQVLCFVNSARTTSRLAFILKALSSKNIKITKLSANLTVKKRNSVLKKFSNGEIDVLISSDALARGIDIPNVQHVISYDAPKFIKTYIHRIGRTGRAGKKGTSIVLLTSKEINYFQKMIQTAGKTSVQKLKIGEDEINQYQKIYEQAFQSLKIVLDKNKQKTISKMKAEKVNKILASEGKFTGKI